MVCDMFSGLARTKDHIKERLGPLWWYSGVMFGVQRLGDLINIYVGLWLVPQCIPASQLGALLPLTQVGALLGLPLAVILIPFLKFTNVFAAKGEMGKVKALLQDMLVIVAVSSIGVAIYTYWATPLVLERMRVGGSGLIGLLCGLAIINALAPVLSNALQSLRNFRTMAILCLIPPPIRLAVLWLTLPVLGIVGYFGVQFLAAVIGIAIAAWGLRSVLSPRVKRETYREHLREMGIFTLPLLVLNVGGAIQATCEMVVIRHVLPDADSAAFYIISRFAEITFGIWGAVSIVFFPFVSERHEQGLSSDRTLHHAMLFTLAAGGLMGLALTCRADWLLGLTPAWCVYRPYSWLMGFLVLRTVLFQTVSCFVLYEIACRRFRFVSLIVVLQLIEAGVLYGLTHIGFFQPYLPSFWWAILASIPACRLDFVAAVMLGLAVLQILGVLAILALRKYHMRGGLSCA